jgi:hypothetical protein
MRSSLVNAVTGKVLVRLAERTQRVFIEARSHQIDSFTKAQALLSTSALARI